MRVEKFTGKVSVDLRTDNPRGLSVAIDLIVPTKKRRGVRVYRLERVEAIPGDNLKKLVTIAVTYQ